MQAEAWTSYRWEPGFLNFLKKILEAYALNLLEWRYNDSKTH